MTKHRLSLHRLAWKAFGLTSLADGLSLVTCSMSVCVRGHDCLMITFLMTRCAPRGQSINATRGLRSIPRQFKHGALATDALEDIAAVLSRKLGLGGMTMPAVVDGRERRRLPEVAKCGVLTRRGDAPIPKTGTVS